MKFQKGQPSWNKGIKFTEEHRRKLSEAHKGKVSWTKGKKLSKEHKRKLSKAHKGKKLSEETKRKIGEANRGRKNSEETKRKMSKAQKGHISWSKGIGRSEETRRKISEAQKGERGHNWKGGITPINAGIRKGIEYKLWREAVFKRDNWTCVWCGIRSQKGIKVIIQADHIKPFANYPALRFAIDNGRTLCFPCHRKTDTYGVNKNL